MRAEKINSNTPKQDIRTPVKTLACKLNENLHSDNKLKEIENSVPDLWAKDPALAIVTYLIRQYCQRNLEPTDEAYDEIFEATYLEDLEYLGFDSLEFTEIELDLEQQFEILTGKKLHLQDVVARSNTTFEDIAAAISKTFESN